MNMKKKPLVIVATPNICWLNPKVDYPKNRRKLLKKLSVAAKQAPVFSIPMPKANGPM